MSFTAPPSPHSGSVALHSERALLALLTPREALDLAASLIKSREALYARPAPLHIPDVETLPLDMAADELCDPR